MRKTTIKEMSYVCTPSNFGIQMKHQMVTVLGRSGLGAQILIFNNNRLILEKAAISKGSFTSRFTYDEILKKKLQELFMFNRNDFIKFVLKDGIYGVPFYDHIKKVQSKLGTTIFVR